MASGPTKQYAFTSFGCDIIVRRQSLRNKLKFTKSWLQIEAKYVFTYIKRNYDFLPADE